VISILLGGRGHDIGRAIALDGIGGIYVAGATDSRNFPITNSVQRVRNGDKQDIFISKFQLIPPSPGPSGAIPPNDGIPGAVVKIEVNRAPNIKPPPPPLPPTVLTPQGRHYREPSRRRP
jgi:hypothetical protein